VGSDGRRVFYLSGLLSLFAGLAIVNLHNMWCADWRALIQMINMSTKGDGSVPSRIRMNPKITVHLFTSKYIARNEVEPRCGLPPSLPRVRRGPPLSARREIKRRESARPIKRGHK
jgi:hypothetical protein